MYDFKIYNKSTIGCIVYWVYGFNNSSKEFMWKIHSWLSMYNHKNLSLMVSFKENDLKIFFSFKDSRRVQDKTSLNRSLSCKTRLSTN